MNNNTPLLLKPMLGQQAQAKLPVQEILHIPVNDFVSKHANRLITNQCIAMTEDCYYGGATLGWALIGSPLLPGKVASLACCTCACVFGEGRRGCI